MPDESLNLDNLSDEEKEQLFRLLSKAEGADGTTEQAQWTPPPPRPSEHGTDVHVDFENREFGEAPAPNPGSPTPQRVISPEDAVERMIRSVQSVGRANYLQGIRAPKRSPIQASIAADEKWKARMQEAMSEDRRKKALETVTDDEWLVMAETVGADKLVDGVVKRKHKVERFWKNWQPLLEQHLRKIDEMPNESDADMEQRMLENLRGLRKLKGQWRRKG